MRSCVEKNRPSVFTTMLGGQKDKGILRDDAANQLVVKSCIF